VELAELVVSLMRVLVSHLVYPWLLAGGNKKRAAKVVPSTGTAFFQGN
jgi:hypothetical protein